MTSAALYARVSTDEQAEHGYSIDAQRDACRAFATARGWVAGQDSLPRATEPVLISCTEGVWVARYLAEPYDLGDIWGKEDGYANEIGPGWFTWQGRFPEVDPEEGVTHWMSLPAAPGTFAWAMEDM